MMALIDSEMLALVLSRDELTILTEAEVLALTDAGSLASSALSLDSLFGSPPRMSLTLVTHLYSSCLSYR